MLLAEKLATLIRILNFVFAVWIFILKYKRVAFSITVSSYKLHYLFCPPLFPILLHINTYYIMFALFSVFFKIQESRKFVDNYCVLWYPGNNIWMNKWILWLKQFIHMSVWQLFHIIFCIKMVCSLF